MSDSESDKLNPPDPPKVPEHELLRCVGAGSHGEVWLARSVTGQYRAVKIVRRDRFADAEPYEREFDGVKRFEPVSRRHAGLIDVLQVGFSEDREFFYCVMELADSRVPPAEGDFDAETYAPLTLQEEMDARGKLPLGECAQLGRELAAALAFLHSEGLVHRDVKPSNVVYVDGRPRLADIGLVSTSDDSALVGTWGYTPREGAGSAAADVYSLGKVLYELATGRDRTEFPELDAPSSEFRGFNRILLQACSDEAEARYRSAAELVTDLDGVLAGELPPLDRSWPRWARAVLVLAIIGLVVVLVRVGDSVDLQEGLLGHWPEVQRVTDMPDGGRSFAVDKLNPHNTTVAFWFRTPDVMSLRSLVATHNKDEERWGWLIRRGQLQFRWRSTHGGHLENASEVSPETWQHLAIVFGSGTGTHLSAYLDGKRIWSLDQPEPMLGLGTELAFGGPDGFQGEFKNVRVYDHALESDALAKLFEQERSDKPVVIPIPIPISNWDWEYAYTNVFNEAATIHLQEQHNVRQYREWQQPPVTYWGPNEIGKPAWMIYRFEFERPTAAIFLRANVKAFNLTQQKNINGAGRGAGALSVSRDGNEWVILRDGLRPEPQWGVGFVFADRLPEAVLGAKEIFVKIELQTEGPNEGSYATAQHSQDRGKRGAVFELKARMTKAQ